MSLGGVNLEPIERYLTTLWEAGASDLLLTAFSPPLMRVDGRLVPIPGEPELDQDQVEHVILGVLTDDLKTELRSDREVDFSFSFNKVARFRANCFFQMGALALSLRMIPLKLPTFEELGLPPAVEYFANLPQGLVLVTGPTGSGKSTSLAAII
ncbi:MAG: ATPase, T2SS/T4P/T4SS family, partial [Bdellovibrionota bacterium]